MNNDDISNNAEYETKDVLNEIEGKDGEALDPIEQDQVVPGTGDTEISDDQSAADALADGIAGNDDNAQDKPLDEENY